MQPQVDIAGGTPVYASDGAIGALRQVVVDSAGGDITHLIIECDDGERLVVPVALVVRADERAVAFRLSQARLLREGVVARFRPGGEFRFDGGYPRGALPGAPPPTVVPPPAPERP